MRGCRLAFLGLLLLSAGAAPAAATVELYLEQRAGTCSEFGLSLNVTESDVICQRITGGTLSEITFTLPEPLQATLALGEQGRLYLHFANSLTPHPVMPIAAELDLIHDADRMRLGQGEADCSSVEDEWSCELPFHLTNATLQPNAGLLQLVVRYGGDAVLVTPAVRVGGTDGSRLELSEAWFSMPRGEPDMEPMAPVEKGAPFPLWLAPLAVALALAHRSKD